MHVRGRISVYIFATICFIVRVRVCLSVVIIVVVGFVIVFVNFTTLYLLFMYFGVHISFVFYIMCNIVCRIVFYLVLCFFCVFFVIHILLFKRSNHRNYTLQKFATLCKSVC